MGEKDAKKSSVMVNRAPVLTLWAAVVAEVLGFEHDEALTLGRAVAGLNAYSKGVSLGLFQPTPKEVQEQRRKMRKEETVTVDLLHRAVPAKHTDEGLRALSGESPIRRESMETYPDGRFGDALKEVSNDITHSRLQAFPGKSKFAHSGGRERSARFRVTAGKRVEKGNRR